MSRKHLFALSAFAALAAFAVLAADPPKSSEPAKVSSVRASEPYHISGPAKAKAGELVELKAEGAGAASVAWELLSDIDLPIKRYDSVASDGTVERSKFAVFAMPSEKKVRVLLIAIAGNTPSTDRFTVELDGAPTPKPDVDPPAPGPNPPGPVPTPGAPFGVLILEDPTKRTAAVSDVLESQEVRSYLSAKAQKEADGKTPKWRIWRHDYTDEQIAQAGGDWPEWFKRAKADSAGRLPWILISDGKSKGDSVPLPATVADMLTLLRKYGG